MKDEEKKAKKKKTTALIVKGLIVHILLLLAVFDVYFASPLDQGMTPIKSTQNPPAKRLVIFVADGLRAEAIYSKDTHDRIPYLKNVLETKGSWGVVHTRVPTESRPGHVAMLAGIYEDPSAILKGWKANPVYFDSVINQSTNAWCWGSPDIVNIFNKDNLSRIHLETYGSEMEDFGKNDTGILDLWVYKKVKEFLTNNVRSCKKDDCIKYFKLGNLFFLHLLGIDTAGHGYKPHSREYIANIKLVDQIVKNTTVLFEQTFKDKSTAYVFTADHGMTDWGSHGSGSPHETEAPIISWGAGVKANQNRIDINQIDIAPLLATLIGVNIPTNSLGILPVKYLDANEEYIALALLRNAKQLLETFNVKRQRTENNSLIYFPYQDITDDKIFEKFNLFNSLERKKQFSTLVKECQFFMKMLIKGLDYYHNYYKYPLLLFVSAGFVLWILFLILSIIPFQKQILNTKQSLGIIFFLTLLTIALLCFKQDFPFTYYFYFMFPVIMFSEVYNLIKTADFNQHQYFNIKENIGNFIFFFIGIELLVYGFFNRFAFTILMLLVALLVFVSDTLHKYSTRNERLVWICCCLVLAIFPSLSVMKTSFNVSLYLFGFIGWLLLFSRMYKMKMISYYRPKIKVRYELFLIQAVCLVTAALYVLLLEYDYIPTDSSIKYISWILLVVPILVIPFTDTYIAVRLMATFFGFSPFYLLVSPNCEALFSVFYVSLLCIWLIIESKSFQYSSSIAYFAKFSSHDKTKSKITSDEFRRAFLFVAFIFLGFFGTGNIASLNSFDPMWVRAFLTVFSPFRMLGLILLKITVPFIFTCCIFRAINVIGKENVLSMFCIILMFSDLMVLQFLYLITNVGSWLDIGTSLSHFIIMEGFVTILLLLYGLAHLLTTVKVN